MRALALSLVSLLLLAGCSGASTPSGPASSTRPDGSVVAANAGLPAPVWQVGDFWNYTGPFGAFDYVVSADAGDDYTVDTDAGGVAWFNTRSDISTMGAIRKSDLAGSQGQTRVQFFDWPLRDNKTWSMTLDEGQGGGTLKVTAKQTGPEAFAMTARRDNGTAYLSYTYDNKTRWFKELDFKDGQGASAFKVTLQRSGKAFAGDLVRWTYDTILKASGDLAQQTPGTSIYGVPATATDVYVDLEVRCASGFAGVGTGPFPFVGSLVGTDDRGAGNPGTQCPVEESFHGVAGAYHAPVPAAGDTVRGENWGYDIVGGAGTVGSFAFSIYIRTAAHFKVGEIPK